MRLFKYIQRKSEVETDASSIDIIKGSMYFLSKSE